MGGVTCIIHLYTAVHFTLLALVQLVVEFFQFAEPMAVTLYDLNFISVVGCLNSQMQSHFSYEG